MHYKVLSLYLSLHLFIPPGQQMCSWKVCLFPCGKGAPAQVLRFLFWLGEAGDLLVFPSSGAVSSHALPQWWISPTTGEISDKCPIYSAPFSAWNLHNSSNYIQNICHPQLICWLKIACKSSSLCVGLCNFLIPGCLNRPEIPSQCSQVFGIRKVGR